MPDLKHHQLTVPGSLLLAGEYTMLGEGGLGLAMAVEPRMTVSWAASDEFQVVTHYEGQRQRWFPEASQGHTLLERVWKVLNMAPPRYSLILDSTPMSRPDGRKMGLGSSAAAAVGAVAALRYVNTGVVPAADEVFQTALTAHRAVQGGRGSGYDVACSCYGGMGLLRGGKCPTWQTVSLSEIPPLALHHAPHSVSTAQAIRQWDAWRLQNPRAGADYVERSNRIVNALIGSRNAEIFQANWRDAAALGRQMGQALGVWDAGNEAFCRNHLLQDHGKALGAGNELYAVLHPDHEGAAVTPSGDGLQWS